MMTRVCKKQSATNTLSAWIVKVGNVTSGQSEGLSSELLQLIYLNTCLRLFIHDQQTFVDCKSTINGK